MLALALLLPLLSAAPAGHVAASDSIAYATFAPHQGADCAPGEPVTRACRVRKPWTQDELRARWEDEGLPLWVDGDTLTFVFEGAHDFVQVCCTVQMPMSRFVGSDLWVLSVRAPGLREAFMTYGFLPSGATRLVEMGEWRGPAAAPAPPQSVALQGSVRTDSLDSVALGERRAVTVYLPYDHDPARPSPVVYVADGQGTEALARYLEPFILAGEVPPVVLVGIHSGPARGEEYTGHAAPGSPIEDPVARFEAHERFLVEEVMPWAERQLGTAQTPDQRAVFGFSNGAVFAAAMALRHPDLFGHAMPFSCGACGQQFPETLPELQPRFYFLAGLLEPGFHRTTARTAQQLRDAGFDAVFLERPSGHDGLMWYEHFGDAVRWAFGVR